MDLLDTVELMTSSNYKDRFKAEYYQVKIRYERLHEMLVEYDANKLNFEPNCDIQLLKEQAKAMGQYLYSLEVRAKAEDIIL